MKLKKFELIKKIGGQPYSVLMGFILEEFVDDWSAKLKKHLPDIELNLSDFACDGNYKLVTEKSEENWTPYLDCKKSEELFIWMHHAEQEQIKLEELENVRMIHVRGKLVGGVDHDTEVRLQLSTENRPALVFRRRGTDLMVMVFLDQWER